jgi:hypothetical protein
MSSMREFLHKQRNASLAVMMTIDSLRDTERSLTADLLRGTGATGPVSAGQATSGREAARRTASVLRSFGEAVRARTSDLKAASAEISEIWTTHEGLWDDLDTDDASLAAEAERGWHDLQDAARRAADGTASFRDSLVRFARSGDSESEAARPALQAQDGLRAALVELDGLVSRYRATVGEVERRLSGSSRASAG